MVWGFSELALSLLKRSKAGAATHDRHSLTAIWLVNLICVTLAVWLAYHAYSWMLPWRRQLYPQPAASLSADWPCAGMPSFISAVFSR